MPLQLDSLHLTFVYDRIYTVAQAPPPRLEGSQSPLYVVGMVEPLSLGMGLA